MKKTKVLLTGATGFLGANLYRDLTLQSNLSVVGTSRHPTEAHSSLVQVGDLNSDPDWIDACRGIDVVIHCAGLAHDQRKSASDYEVANVQGTLNLARQALLSGVKRFIFISSIGVNGVSTSDSKAFTSSDLGNPEGGYALSKWKAERLLSELCSGSSMELVILRPPLIYGPGAPGSFGLMLKSIHYSLPLPLGSIHNKRSFVSVWNVINLIKILIDHPNAAGEVFLVSDDHDLSTSEFFSKLAKASANKVIIYSFPVSLLKMCAHLVGKQRLFASLVSDLRIDIDHTKSTLDWTPPLSVEEGLSKCFV